MTKRATLTVSLLCAMILPGFLGLVGGAQAQAAKPAKRAAVGEASAKKKVTTRRTAKKRKGAPAPFEKSTTLDLIIFWGLALGTAGFSLLMITRKTPMTSALCLLGVFLNLAGVYVLLQAPFMAFIQLIVYAGAVIVLFVFVIMSVGAAHEEEGLPEVATYVGGMVLSGIGAVMLLYAEQFNITSFLLLNLIALALFIWRLSPYPITRFLGTAASSFAVVQLIRLATVDQVPLRITRTDFGSVASVGRSVFRDNVFAFEALSLLLLAAIVAAVVLVRSAKQEGLDGEPDPAPAEESQ